VFPGIDVNPANAAVVGMACMVGASTGAAVTAVVMIFEMTRDYAVIIPMTITVTLSYAVRWAMQPESIYTLKVARRGKPVPQALQANFFYIRHARDIMTTNLGTVSPSTPFARFLRSVREHGNGRYFLVGDPDRVFGLIAPDAVRDALAGTVPARSVHDLTMRDYVTVADDTTVFEVLTRMRRAHVSVALVKTSCQDPTRGTVIGVITKEQLADTVQAGVELFAD
jgi:CIC family chloride channel protein